MVSLVIYGDSEKETINKAIDNLKDIKVRIGAKLNKDTYNKDIIYGENRFKIYSSLNNVGVDGLIIEDNETKNVYYMFLEKEALKYCGRSSLYLNEIYCSKSVNKEGILKLYEPCVRNKDLLFPIGLDHWNFNEIYWNR